MRLHHATTFEFFDQDGTFIAEADWPAPGVEYVGADKLRPNPTTPGAPRSSARPSPLS